MSRGRLQSDSPLQRGRTLMPVPTAEPIVLVLATRNRKKGEELAQLLDPPWEPKGGLEGVLIRALEAFPDLAEVVEDADTFAGNARKKAAQTAQSLARWVLADDSGLAVTALKGAPGVYSARYAGQHGDDAANNRKVLDELSDVADDERGAAFVCALALADPTGAIRLEAEAACRGRITHEPRGSGGFGYDPIFLIREYHKTFGELSPLVKQQLSHRARAAALIRPGLRRLLLGAR